jgi:peptide/nickel transport system permease protein
MLVYIVRRLLAAVVLLLIVTAATFVIFFVLPRIGGATVDDLASRYVGKSGSVEDIHAIAVKLGFTDPIYVQYGRFIGALFVGADYSTGPTTVHCPAPCLGYSFINQNPVLPDLLDRLPVTLSLAAGAAVLWLVGGVSVGVLSALRRGSVFDRAAMGVALAGVSLPIFFTGLLSLAIFSYGLGWIDGKYVPLTESFTGWLGGMILPWVTLAFLYAAMYARITRATMLEVLGEDYIRTARAKGLKEQVVISKHAMRSTMTPILTMLGMDLGALIGGAILTETTFSLPGLGQAVLNAIKTQDLPIILGVTLITSLAVLIANLVVDVLYAVIDPRVRLT